MRLAGEAFASIERDGAVLRRMVGLTVDGNQFSSAEGEATAVPDSEKQVKYT